MQAIFDADIQTEWTKVAAAARRQKLPGRARQAGWQWQGQRARLADSPDAIRQADKQPSRQLGRQAGR
jgi:hypothetical protein